MSGEHPLDPLSLPADGTSYRKAAQSGRKPKRVALSRDLGITPVEPEVAEIVMAAGRRFAEAGVLVEEAHPDFSEAHECFQTLRALSFATGLKPLLDQHRDKLKPEVIWNIEKGLALGGAQIAKAEAQRAAMFKRAGAFFDTYDLLLCPATVVAPYPVEQRYPTHCDGHKFENYVEWLAIVYAITNVASPAISIPAGFTSKGLPVGIQLAARCRNEAGLLAGAKLLEDILGLSRMTPINPGGQTLAS
jgi:amidase